MCFYRRRGKKISGRWLLVPLLAAAAAPPSPAAATQFEASLAPRGRYVLKVYPTFFFTSAFFSDDGKARHLPGVTGLLYFELPVQVQYGVTGSLSVGAVLPVGWSYQEEDLRPDPVNNMTVRDFWITVQHRWLTFPFVSSSSLRVKIPVADKKEWEDGLRVGDGQVDLYPAYHFDYFDEKRYWYLSGSIGYNYRFKSGGTKPFDELSVYAQGGYELFPDLRMRFYLYADLTDFRNGEFNGGSLRFFEHEGSLHHFGYGVSLWPRPTLRLELATGGDWSGTNQYRGIRWTAGVTKIL